MLFVLPYETSIPKCGSLIKIDHHFISCWMPFTCLLYAMIIPYNLTAPRLP